MINIEPTPASQIPPVPTLKSYDKTFDSNTCNCITLSHVHAIIEAKVDGIPVAVPVNPQTRTYSSGNLTNAGAFYTAFGLKPPPGKGRGGGPQHASVLIKWTSYV
jgi:hypothetical protein